MFTLESFRSPDRKYGPLQIVHDFQFVALNLPGDFDWTEQTTQDEKVSHIRWRLERLSRRGYSGVVINVAFQDYMENSAAWERLVNTVDMARDMGLRLWIYDEQYYPSGSAGGLTLREHPQYEAQALACVTLDINSPDTPVRVPSPKGHSSLKFAYAVPLRDGCVDFEGQQDIVRYIDTGGGLCWDCPGGQWRVYCYFTRSLYEGTYLCRALRAPRRNISVCDDRAVKRFLDVTYGAYEKWLGDRLYNDIEAVFIDEPSMFWYAPYPKNQDPRKWISKLPTVSMYEIPDATIPIYPYIHWTYNMEERFFSNNGYSLVDSLPRLFEGGADAARIRLDYHRTLDNLFDEAFSRQYRERMSGYGIGYSGHMIYEEKIAMHPHCYGDILRNLGQMDIPGCDLLYSDPEMIRHSIACKLASSAAHGYGRDHVMIEASNMYDKDQTLTLPVLLSAMATEFALGVDTITSYYGENLLSESEYGKFAAYVARLGTLFDGGTHISQALVYYPFEQLASETYVQNPLAVNDKSQIIEDSNTKISQSLLMRQIDFDYVNDEILLKCQLSKGRLVTPAGETPSLLIFPAVDWLGEEIAALVTEAVSQEIKVAFCGDPRPIGGLRDTTGIRFIGNKFPFVSCDFRASDSCPYLLSMHKRFSGQELYLLVNTGMQELRTEASIPCGGGSYQDAALLNPADGTIQSLICELKENRLHFILALDPLTARVLLIDETGQIRR